MYIENVVENYLMIVPKTLEYSRAMAQAYYALIRGSEGYLVRHIRAILY